MGVHFADSAPALVADRNDVIARAWRGRVPAHRSDEYLAYLRATGLADYAATPGHVWTLIMHRLVDGVAEFQLVTFWESLDAIRRFAGDDVTRARYYPQDKDFLLDPPQRVEHWEVLTPLEPDMMNRRRTSGTE